MGIVIDQKLFDTGNSDQITYFVNVEAKHPGEQDMRGPNPELFRNLRVKPRTQLPLFNLRESTPRLSKLTLKKPSRQPKLMHRRLEPKRGRSASRYIAQDIYRRKHQLGKQTINYKTNSQNQPKTYQAKELIPFRNEICQMDVITN